MHTVVNHTRRRQCAAARGRYGESAIDEKVADSRGHGVAGRGGREEGEGVAAAIGGEAGDALSVGLDGERDGGVRGCMHGLALWGRVAEGRRGVWDARAVCGMGRQVEGDMGLTASLCSRLGIGQTLSACTEELWETPCCLRWCHCGGQNLHYRYTVRACCPATAVSHPPVVVRRNCSSLAKDTKQESATRIVVSQRIHWTGCIGILAMEVDTRNCNPVHGSS